MQVTKATFSSECLECWITVRSVSGEPLVVHVLSEKPMQWSLKGNTLNVMPKKEG